MARATVARILFLLCTLWAIGACGDEGAEPPVATAPPANPGLGAAGATATPTLQPLPTATDLPSPPPATDQPVLSLPAPLYVLADGQIVRLETDGTTVTQLTQEQEDIVDFAVSPVDARLAYVAGNTLIEADPRFATRFVKVAGEPVDRQDAADLVQSAISDPVFSPDGSQLAFGLNGVNLVPVGESGDYRTILPSDPYPDPNNPPRQPVRFFRPRSWSPDGSRLLVGFSYWPEAGGLAILPATGGAPIDVTSEDPNGVLCCDWAWGQEDDRAFIASDLIAYGNPGLSRVDVASGEATNLLQTLPPQGPSVDTPLRLFRSVHQPEPGLLLSFVSQQSDPSQPAPYTMHRVRLDEMGLEPLGEEGFEQPGEILWAQDGRGAVLVDNGPDPSAGSGPMFWLPADGGPAVELPVAGARPRWGVGEILPIGTTTPGPDAVTEGDARGTAQVLLNVRSGPGTAYPVVGELEEGTVVAIIGVSPDGQWWQVVEGGDGSGPAWISGDPALVAAENTEDVVEVDPPPLPEPSGQLFYSATGSGGAPAIYVQSLALGATPRMLLENASQPGVHDASGRLALRSTRSDLLGLGVWQISDQQMVALTSHAEDSLPRWSPDGSRLVFASTRHGDRRWRIYTQLLSGSEPAREIRFGLDPDWHPTRDLIAFKGCDEQGERCGIWAMDSAGENPRPLTANKTDSRPVWSPDGGRVVFMSESRADNWEVYAVDTAGNVVTRLTDNPALDGLPAISPDGSRVAFVSNRDGAWGIYILPISGGEARRVVTIGADLPNWLEQGIDWAR